MTAQKNNVQYTGLVCWIIKANQDRNIMAMLVGIGATMGGIIVFTIGFMFTKEGMELLGFLYSFEPYSFISLSLILLVTATAASLMRSELVIALFISLGFVAGGTIAVLASFILGALSYFCIPAPVGIIVFVLIFNMLFKVEAKEQNA